MNTTPAIVALAAALGALTPQDARQDAEAPRSAESAASDASRFTGERLEQLVGPIALYPDPLLSQILIASTYPLEVVEASRWIQQNPGLTGSALEEALKAQAWDASVKSLCGFPTVLKRMDDDLNWTRDLGDAFLGQKPELMDAVQRMRKKALDAGTLKSTDPQKVVEEQGAISIQPSSPEVIYVPTYSPVVVYGPGWSYPYWYYPYWYYPPPIGAGFVTFSAGFFWGFGCWSHCDWHQHVVVVDVVRYRTFHARTSTGPIPPRFASPTAAAPVAVPWEHDPVHRAGVAYRSPAVARSFGADPRTLRVESQAIRAPASFRTEPSRSSAPRVEPTRPSPPSYRPPPPSPGRERPPSSEITGNLRPESMWTVRERGTGSRDFVDGFRRHRSP